MSVIDAVAALLWPGEDIPDGARRSVAIEEANGFRRMHPQEFAHLSATQARAMNRSADLPPESTEEAALASAVLLEAGIPEEPVTCGNAFTFEGDTYYCRMPLRAGEPCPPDYDHIADTPDRNVITWTSGARA